MLALQSIFDGSEDVKVTVSPVRKARQESKLEKPNTDWTYWTGKSGLNLQRENRRHQQGVRSTDTSLLDEFFLTYVLTMARSAMVLSLSTNLSIRYEAMRGASKYNLKNL